MASDHNISTSHTNNNASEGSKFKRFLKKFGRKPSDEAVTSPSHSTLPPASSAATASTPSGQTSHDDSLHTSGPFNSKSGAKASKSRSKNAFAPNSSTTRAEPLSVPSPTTDGQCPSSPMTFGGSSGQGLADTLVVPRDGVSQPPQLVGLPSHEPLTPPDLSQRQNSSAPGRPANMSAAMANAGQTSTLEPSTTDFREAGRNVTGALVKLPTVNDQGGEAIRSIPTSSSLAVEEQVGGSKAATAPGSGMAPPSSFGRATHFSDHSISPSRSGAGTSFEDVDSTEGIRRRDSSDTRTVDTGKSTKPTTLMSLDTRENVGHSHPAHIAQHRHGEQSSPTFHTRAAGGSPSIQFAGSPSAGRGVGSGTVPLVNLPGYGDPSDQSPYTNVPAISRPHPANNPAPSGIPADNASVLTLASSTATHSIGTGTPSVRQGGGAGAAIGHHYTPSLGGARSIGGSLMGDRRNSSDTYASVRALPPLSRRGSDASTRTGKDSFAPPSAAGLTSANAMTTSATAGSTVPHLLSSGANASSSNIALNATGTGAPADRMGMKRTDSQRTVATQLSIPLSVSASNHAALLTSSTTDRRGSSGSANLLGGGSGAGGGALSSHREVGTTGVSNAPSAGGGGGGAGISSTPIVAGAGPPSSAAAPALFFAGADSGVGNGDLLTAGQEEEGGGRTDASLLLPTRSELHHENSSGAQMLKMAEEGEGDGVEGGLVG